MMGTTFQLDVVTPESLLVSGQATFITAPGKDGRFGVLAGHTPFVSLLMAGELTIVMERGTPEQRYALSGGFAEVANDRVTLLVERALEKSQIDLNAAVREEQEAIERLAQLPQGGHEALVWGKRRDFAKTCQQLARATNA
ncbi:MAG: ATP synthase F1 subunit epsilon [Magnetococcales bacterium]|nr:ATP synthase F1 subunit epsilon [Magnetococcales bacterium]MBF0348516.1 ATP synthase F1 subunit epsilon [Magnetococcales bacterium]MBF0630667.1 ATP synthase F1 subunit epsilon [Magnetococcales bacterium]